MKKALVDAFQMAERNLPLMLGREVTVTGSPREKAKCEKNGLLTCNIIIYG